MVSVCSISEKAIAAQQPIMIGGGTGVRTITVYKPKGDPVTYVDPTKVSVDSGVLTFFWTKEISGKDQQVITNLPFIIQHDVKQQ
jgi:hypothetical protein